MKNKKIILLIVLFLAIGFAAVSTTLFINGTVTYSTNKDDFDVYFSGAEIDNVDVSNEVIKDKKHIEYTSNELKKLNDTSVLKYEVTNDSTEYDATVTISCTPMKTDYVEVTLTPVTFDIDAGEIKTGEIEAKLIKVSETEQNISIDCELSVVAKSRTAPAEITNNDDSFMFAGTLIDNNGDPLSNAYLVICSQPQVIKTDSNGYFYVDGLERGTHEIYYLENEPTNIDIDLIKAEAKGMAKISTNNTKEIKLSNNFIINNYYVGKKEIINIELNSDGGVVNQNNIIANVKGFYDELPIPTKDNYKFLGWFDNYGQECVPGSVVQNNTTSLTAHWASSIKNELTFADGQYIKLKPTASIYNISSSLTGYSTDQSINPSELDIWRVIRINDDGTIDAISEYTSSNYINFYGKTGYINYVTVLQNIASNYTDGQIVVGTRHAGYNGQIGTITNLTYINQQSGQLSASVGEAYGGTETKYTTDYNLITSVLKTGVSKNRNSKENSEYYISSRTWIGKDSLLMHTCNIDGYTYTCGAARTYPYQYAKYVNTEGVANDGELHHYAATVYAELAYQTYNSYPTTTSFAIRPIITISADAFIVKGDGLSEDAAYELSL